MEFIDKTGHIFSMTSYDSYPTGYEYETNDYIFWLDDDYTRRLSVDNYYMKAIRVVLPSANGIPSDIVISSDSSVFRLVGESTIAEELKNNGGFYIELDEDDGRITKTLKQSNGDFSLLSDDDYILVTFYIIGCAAEAATWTSQILIDVTYEDRHVYCPITVGMTTYDECEELVINGQNMGLHLPKDIIKAVYGPASGTSIYSAVNNEALYNEKVKEYLLNWMRLEGEKGNVRQMTDGLSFFGWGDKIRLSQLVRTDNDIISQYIRQYIYNGRYSDNTLPLRFDIFDNTGMVSIDMPLNGDSGKREKQNFDADFWGEGSPILEDYTNKVVGVQYEVTEVNNKKQTITFQKRYFDYMTAELALKISCLRHFYQKYFLPLHSLCLSASVSEQTFTNDIKYVAQPSLFITEHPVMAEADCMKQTVIFPSTDILYAYSQEHYVDSDFNELSRYVPVDRYHDITTDDEVYYIDDICVTVPLKFHSDNDYIHCHLILERLGGTVIHESDFAFCGNDTYRNFVIYPKLMNDRQSINYWTDKHYCLHLCVNDIWYEYEFVIKSPHMHLQFGKLQYEYDNALFRQISVINDDVVDFQTFMYLPSAIDVLDIRFVDKLLSYGKDNVMSQLVQQYRESPSLVSPSETGSIAKKYYNRMHHYILTDNDDNEIEYVAGDTEDSLSEESLNLYRKVFNDDGTQKKEYVIGGLSYDIYLMHDSASPEDYHNIIDVGDNWKPHWYAVLISRETIDCGKDDMEAPSLDVGDMKGKVMASQNIFLINRMKFVPSRGINRFNTSDIIVGNISNVEMPFILSHGSHWTISPFSLAMGSATSVDANANTFMMSLSDDNNAYVPGYYNITVRYSLDGEVQYQTEHHARVLVTKTMTDDNEETN